MKVPAWFRSSERQEGNSLTTVRPQELEGPQRVEREEITRDESVPSHDSLMKCLPSGSVYLWAARLDGARTSDAMVGWIVLLIQVLCYIVLLEKSPKRSPEDLRRASVMFRTQSTDDDDIPSIYSDTQGSTNGEGIIVLEAFQGNPVSYAISSIAVAVFLVVAFAGADLRGSWALVQTRGVYNVALGLTIFASFVLLVLSSMSALFFLANDDVSFIVGAAAVLFISDLDEKLWAILKTMDSRCRLIWVIEAVFLSVALAVMGVIWFGKSSATTQDGLSPTKGSPGWPHEEYYRGLIFNWYFAYLVAPIGLTVLAWQVAFSLQSIADRFDSNNEEAMPTSSNLKQLILLEAAFFVYLSPVIFHVSSLSQYWICLFIIRLALPVPLAIVGIVGMCLPPVRCYLSYSSCKILIGMGIGGGFYFLTTVSGYFFLYSSSVVNDPAAVFVAAMVSIIFGCFLARAIFESFERIPARFSAISWRCTALDLSSSEGCDRGTPAVFGTTFVVVCMYARLYVIEQLVYAVCFGNVKF